MNEYMPRLVEIIIFARKISFLLMSSDNTGLRKDFSNCLVCFLTSCVYLFIYLRFLFTYS